VSIGEADSVPIAVVRNGVDMIEGLRAAKDLRNLSNSACDERMLMALGNTDKIIGPSAVKGLSWRNLELYLELFACKLLLVVDPEGEAKMRRTWEGREERNVRAMPNRVSSRVLEIAKPHILRDKARAGGQASGAKRTGSDGSETMRRVARARWKGKSLKMDKRSKRRRAWWRAKRMPKRISDEAGGET
jgi:hypothetical protein